MKLTVDYCYMLLHSNNKIKNYEQTKFNNTLKGPCTMIKVNLSHGCKESSIQKSMNVINFINKLQNELKSYKHFNRHTKELLTIQYTLRIRTLNKVGIEGSHPT